MYARIFIKSNTNHHHHFLFLLLQNRTYRQTIIDDDQTNNWLNMLLYLIYCWLCYRIFDYKVTTILENLHPSSNHYWPNKQLNTLPHGNNVVTTYYSPGKTIHQLFEKHTIMYVKINKIYAATYYTTYDISLLTIICMFFIARLIHLIILINRSFENII